jgi:(2S)-methylsuccinyl-CoA dehydrogenase
MLILSIALLPENPVSTSRQSALSLLDHVCSQVTATLAARVARGGRFDRRAFDELQPEAFEFARILGEREGARAVVRFTDSKFASAYDADLADVYLAMSLQRLAGSLTAFHDSFGVATTTPEFSEALAWSRQVMSTANLRRIAEALNERTSEQSGSLQLGPDYAEVRRTFQRFADQRVEPLAEAIHREDRIIPEDLLKELGDLGVFGISIPEEYGGMFVDNLTMCIATEELSRASLGAGGSVITRPEICAKAVLKGGTEEQKQRWLPEIASGETLVSVAVTEPNAGSDVASLRVTARKVDGGYRIDGEKTWCTFAGRANVFILLARTGSSADGARGLTLFLVEKPAKISADDHHTFSHRQEEGGTVEGHAIPTIGYRGMHSFSVSFDNYFVPDANRIGAEGDGFALQMEGFAGGRIQTAARAVGVMEAAFRKAVRYASERKVFGAPLRDYTLSVSKLVRMAALIHASRRLSYDVAVMMDNHEGQMEASLVKLISCKDAEWVTREAMQLHGGMGYSLEYAVSRHWEDARVLSIFEGAEEVLALYVVARQALRDAIEG